MKLFNSPFTFMKLAIQECIGYKLTGVCNYYNNIIIIVTTCYVVYSSKFIRLQATPS